MLEGAAMMSSNMAPTKSKSGLSSGALSAMASGVASGVVDWRMGEGNSVRECSPSDAALIVDSKFKQ